MIALHDSHRPLSHSQHQRVSLPTNYGVLHARRRDLNCPDPDKTLKYALVPEDSLGMATIPLTILYHCACSREKPSKKGDEQDDGAKFGALLGVDRCCHFPAGCWAWSLHRLTRSPATLTYASMSGFLQPYGRVVVTLNNSTTATITFTANESNPSNAHLCGGNGTVAVNVTALSWTLGSITGTPLTARSTV
jgi:hypothetical protein